MFFWVFVGDSVQTFLLCCCLRMVTWKLQESVCWTSIDTLWLTWSSLAYLNCAPQFGPMFAVKVWARRTFKDQFHMPSWTISLLGCKISDWWRPNRLCNTERPTFFYEGQLQQSRSTKGSVWNCEAVCTFWQVVESPSFPRTTMKPLGRE